MKYRRVIGDLYRFFEHIIKALKMSKRILLVMTVLAIAWPVCALARMRDDVSVELKGPRGGGVYVAAVQQNEAMVNSEIQIRQDTDLTQDNATSVTYNENGTISSVSYPDGTVVLYSDYQLDNDGNIGSFTATTDRGSVIFNSINPNGGDGKAYVRLSSENGRNSESVVRVFLPDDGHGLNDIATKPLPNEFFKSINKALDDLANARKSAKDEYVSKTEHYYVNVEEKLGKMKNKFVSEGAFVSEFLKEADAAPTQSAKRKAVDEAVGYLYAKGRSGEKNETIEDFLKVEKGLRDKIIVPEMQIYEGKIESALKYVYSIIDELMKSKLALFMDANKDKIEAIINLPKRK